MKSKLIEKRSIKIKDCYKKLTNNIKSLNKNIGRTEIISYSLSVNTRPNKYNISNVYQKEHSWQTNWLIPIKI